MRKLIGNLGQTEYELYIEPHAVRITRSNADGETTMWFPKSMLDEYAAERMAEVALKQIEVWRKS